MKKKQKKLVRPFVVRYRHTEVCEIVIDAVDEKEAREKFDLGEWSNVNTRSLDTIDMEIVSLKEEL